MSMLQLGTTALLLLTASFHDNAQNLKVKISDGD